MSNLSTNEENEKEVGKLSEEELSLILEKFHVKSFHDYEMIDSSHGANDIRHNYIIDRAYVLRVNSASVMTERRIRELNPLIRRYNDFGLKAPYFICDEKGNYLVPYRDCYCYLSEYLDYRLAEEGKESSLQELIEERLVLISKFAEQYKDYALVETMSMYSLFDLAPYDISNGIDEKQDNFNILIQDLKEIGEEKLAERLIQNYKKVRNKLLAFYKKLPRCVFQGDENFSNLCIDDENHIIGLFDFNMSGTEVIANYLANIAFQGKFVYTDDFMADYTAEEIFSKLITSYRESTEIMKKYYHFSQAEKEAYLLYSQIVMISGYVNQSAFSVYLKNGEYRSKTIELLQRISKADLSAFIAF